MLQQILRDLYVDPEILLALDETQKQTLFCKMREEQVRRWREYDEKCSTLPKQHDKDSGHKKKKSVSFLKGSDGEPWVWVMGEHQNDMTIDEILKAEAMEKARRLAERETVAMRQQLIDCIDLTPKIDEEIYSSVDELKKQMKQQSSSHHNHRVASENYKIGHYHQQQQQQQQQQRGNINNNNNNKFNNVIDTNDVLNEMNVNASKKVAAKVAQWERRLTEERTCEILKNIQSKRLQAAKEAEEHERKHESFWREQERKAKEAEQQIREIARKAREEHRLTLNTCKLEFEPAYNYNAVAPGVPPGKQAVIDWYKNEEIPRLAGIDRVGRVEPYFHGLISRNEAELLLHNQPDGTFLVRLSERLWGYAISYRSKDKFKHYLVNAGSNYSFLGNNQVEHWSLGDLISYHNDIPLTGGERLIQACPRVGDAAIWELFAQEKI